MFGGFGQLQLCGTAGSRALATGDTFHSFRAQLVAFIDYLRSGKHPFPFSETIELMKLVIAGRLSREQGGRVINLSEVEPR